MCFLDQLRSSSAPDLTLGIPKGLVIIYFQGTGKYRGFRKKFGTWKRWGSEVIYVRRREVMIFFYFQIEKKKLTKITNK